MNTPPKLNVRKTLVGSLIALLAIGLSGCYSVSGSVRLEGTEAKSATARVAFQGSIPEERLSQGVPIERDSNGERDDSARVEWLRSYFDPFLVCCGNPVSNHINYVAVGGEEGTWTPANGRMIVWTDVPIADGPVFRTESFGGLELTTERDYAVVRASMKLPADRTGEATGGFFEVAYPDNWFLVESNGTAGYNDYWDEQTVYWSGKPGDRVDILAAFQVYKDAADVPQLQVTPFVDGEGNEVAPQQNTQPQELNDLAYLADQAIQVEADVDTEWIINSDGELVELSNTESSPESALGGFLVGSAWGLLGAGVLSGLIVLVVATLKRRKTVTE